LGFLIAGINCWPSPKLYQPTRLASNNHSVACASNSAAGEALAQP